MVINNNANVSFRLWDKATGMTAGQNSGYFIGLSIMDTPSAEFNSSEEKTVDGTD